MISFFQYNWMVRDEWFDICSRLPYEELVKERVGGVKTILNTLFHIVVVEESWISDIKGVPEGDFHFEDYQTVESIRKLSNQCKKETERIVRNWDASKDYETIMCPVGDGRMEGFTYGEILRHMIAHEIHHIGQFSVWARDIGIQPASSNLIRRGLFLER
jgi:uncharacterized damage-inducible protein DinB